MAKNDLIQGGKAMLLSRIVYECVKSVKYLDESSFTYESFRKGEFDKDPDYQSNINNVFFPLNEAIHRLSDRNKIKNRVVELQPSDDDGKIDISSVKTLYGIKNFISVFYLSKGNYKKVSYRDFGFDAIVVMDSDYFGKTLFAEFREDIKNFTAEDFSYTAYEDGTEFQKDTDLGDYGLSETMCSYIIEYVKGQLMENIAPEIANLHLTRAEQYFDDLEEQQTSFEQKSIGKWLRV